MSHFAMRPITTQKVTSSGSSAASSAFGSNVEYVRVIADADCHIEFGVAPTATNAKIFLASKSEEFFKVSEVKKLLL